MEQSSFLKLSIEIGFKSCKNAIVLESRSTVFVYSFIDQVTNWNSKGNHLLSIDSKTFKFKCKTDIDYPSLLAGLQPATGWNLYWIYFKVFHLKSNKAKAVSISKDWL